MKLYVHHDTYCDYDRREDTGDGPYEYTWSSSFSHEILGVQRECPDARRYMYEAFEVDFAVEDGDMVYVLDITYSTGDSFGHSEGNYEVMWVFKDQDVATAAEKMIYANEKKLSFKIVVESGEVVELSNPAFGYFNRLSSVNVEAFGVA